MKEGIKKIEEGIKKIEEGHVVKKDSLLSLTILIDSRSNRCVFESFCFKWYLVSDFIASNY